LERDAGPCLLIGHSLGGAAAVLAAHRLRTLDGVVAIASPADAGHVRHLLGDDGAARIRAEGRAPVDIGGRPFEIGAGFLDDLDDHDVIAAASELTVPLLVVEAGADTVVGADQTARLAAAASGSLRRVAGADHLFSDRRHADELARTILDWLDSIGR